MTKMYVIPAYNGWTNNAGQIMGAIRKRELNRAAAERETENAIEHEHAELEYYEENNCYPQPAGYFGTETDAHFFERWRRRGRDQNLKAEYVPGQFRRGYHRRTCRQYASCVR